MALGKKYHYKPQNPSKYVGKNINNIILRSSWEVTYARWCDTNASVIEWSSESIIVPYRTILDEAKEKKQNLNYKIYHKYYVDFYVKVKTRAGKVNKYLIEIKPYHETIEPVFESKQRTKTQLTRLRTWIVNSAKWKAAEQFAADRNMKFKKLTERDLYGGK